MGDTGRVTGARAALALGIVLAIVGATMVADLGRPFGNGDEVLYAQGVREMQRGAGHDVLRWGGQEVLERPVAPFVLAALGANLVDGEVGLRLSSLVAALVVVALVFWIALRTFGRIPAAAAAAILCALAPSFHLFGRALLSDPPFTAALVAAVGATLWAQDDRRGLVAAGVALGAATAMKSLAAGPAIVAVAPWLVVAARRHGTRRILLAGLAGYVALAAPFFVVGLVTRGPAFVRE